MKTLANSIIVLFLSLVLSFGLLGAGKQKADLTTDDAINDLVRRKLANDPEVRGGRFEVDVKSGVVTIKGVVEKERIKAKAAKLTMKVNGVKKVDNQLTISPTRN